MTKIEKDKIKGLIGKWLSAAKNINGLEKDKVVEKQDQIKAVRATVKTFEQCAEELVMALEMELSS